MHGHYLLHTVSTITFVNFLLENTAEADNSEQEANPPFTLHIGMLFTAICRLVNNNFMLYLVCWPAGLLEVITEKQRN